LALLIHRFRAPALACALLSGGAIAGPLSAQAVDVEPREARVPRVDASIEVDGVLDEPVWGQAVALDGFSRYLPVDGRPAEDDTEVLVWYSATAIHFGIRASEGHTEVRSTLADRDRIEGGDYVQLVLDPFDDQREAFVFGVNPLGVQADGILRDATRRAGSGFSAGGSEAYTVDDSPDFFFESRGIVTETGYQVEVRIPFESLRFPSGGEQRWAFNVIRKVQHSGSEDTWSPLLQARSSFLAQNGILTGFQGLERESTVELNPVLTARLDGGSSPDGWSYQRTGPEVGGNVQWAVTGDMTLSGTVNPDFSQVEADVAQVQFDPRAALFFPEKRPFFLEGIEQFAMPVPLIYSRRLVEPVGALKVTGKAGETSLGVFAGVDDRSVSASGSDRPRLAAVRLRRNVGSATVGLALTDRVAGDHVNRVASTDGRLVGGSYSATYQIAGSYSRTGDDHTVAPLWSLAAERSGRRFGVSWSMLGVHPDFRADAGFVRQADLVNMSLTPRVSVFGPAGAAVESWTGSVALSGRWDYGRFLDGEIPNDPKLHLNSAFSFRGGWRVGTSVLIESFLYPPELYTDYLIERRTAMGVDTVAFTGTERLGNLDFLVSVATPKFQSFWGDARIIVGRDENFYEWASAHVLFLTVNLNFRPTNQLRIEGTYNHQQYIRPGDGSTVGMRRIPGLRVEYQLSRSVFVRFVGQYVGDLQDALRDDSRTGDPILVLDRSTGLYVRSERWTRNDLRVDWLFSYRPTPGTVVFLGYGSSLQEPDFGRFRQVERVSDGFFVKLSYLLRR